MRALLVVNHMATMTSGRARDVVTSALRSAVQLEVVQTARRGHATALARQAAADGIGLVVALGGDGTVNEVVNGLLADVDPRIAAGGAEKIPALAVVPGGSTNVFARALGLPRDPIEATGALLEALDEERVREIGLGRADERYFTFCAGLGLDAQVIRRVERARLRGRSATPWLYIQSVMSQYVSDKRRGAGLISLAVPGHPEVSHLATVVIQNTTPWTYLGSRPIDACPNASFDLGLDLLAMRALHLPSTARTVGQLLGLGGDRGGAGGPHGRQVLRMHDLAEFTLSAAEPTSFQLDGDYLGERQEVRFVSVPTCIRVFC